MMTILSLPLILLIRIYQIFISPWLPPACRYEPSCSNYFLAALRKRGPIMGVFLGVGRLLRCHPFGGSGYDPVP